MDGGSSRIRGWGDILDLNGMVGGLRESGRRFGGLGSIRAGFVGFLGLFHKLEPRIQDTGDYTNAQANDIEEIVRHISKHKVTNGSGRNVLDLADDAGGEGGVGFGTKKDRVIQQESLDRRNDPCTLR
eukprot:TRINITY_DN4436_c0_g1_i4.p1 TRINITY_DN4436_c0_g1~~TRINITY_DN4436_c0_g1_i4.p1  ORF type:complete len:128 (+),score=13.00 TRINITY_DN4436_c0_g1_i4:166-549(+)